MQQALAPELDRDPSNGIARLSQDQSNTLSIAIEEAERFLQQASAYRSSHTPIPRQSILNLSRALAALRKREPASLDLDVRIEALVASGMTKANDIAKVIGISTAGTTRRLLNMGLDAEMRRELAAEGRKVGAA